jgi:EAL domain-containing protein (putative c-di-GMP-specific phosphodiesterase class I)
LKQLAVSKLKIDRSFTATLSENAGDAAIVKAIIQLGQTMQLEVVAEGVETADHLGFLKRRRLRSSPGFVLLHAHPRRRCSPALHRLVIALAVVLSAVVAVQQFLAPWVIPH